MQKDAGVPTGLMFTAVTPDGERTMFGQRGANPHTDPAAISLDTLRGVDLLHLSGYALLEAPQRQAALRALDLALRGGLPVTLDTAYLPALQMPEVLRQLPAGAGCLHPRPAGSVGDARRRGARGGCPALLEAGVRLAALKLGAAGCLLADGATRCISPAFPVDVVDTTGAGDAFSAGVIYARLHGLSLPALGVLANALGGLATTVPGAGTALPGREEELAFLRLQADPAPDRVAAIAEAVRSLA